MNPRIAFLTALIGSCRGTGIFDQLKDCSWKRTVWHLFLMSILIGAAIGTARYRRISPVIKAAEVVFTESFGSKLHMEDGSFFPSLSPERSRELSFPFGGRLFYVGTGRHIPSPSRADLESVTLFILWGAPDIANASRLDDNRWGVLRRNGSGALSVSVLSTEELPGLFAEIGRARPASSRSTVIPTAELFSSFLLGGALWLFGGAAAECFLITLLYTGIFMLVFRFSGARNLRVLSVGSMWKCGIYAGFPAMLVAMCFPIFDLPLLSFDSAYMAGMLIYWMIVANRIERDGRANGVTNG